MHKISALSFAIYSLTSLSLHAQETGFVPIDPATLNTVSGKSLMLTSYAVILGVILLYTAGLLLRDRRINLSINALKNRLQNK